MVEKRQKTRVSLVQMDPWLGAVEQNRGRILNLAEQAAAEGAQIIIFPELSTSGCMLMSREAVYRAAEPVPGGPTVKSLEKMAKERNCYLVVGLPELGEDRVSCYNTAVLVGPCGYIGKHRKLNLWDVDKLYFEPGDLGYQVFPTPLGRIAMLVCYDMWFPENFRILAAMGADLICCPTNWMRLSADQPLSMGSHMAMAAAGANHIYVAAADRVGREGETVYCGASALLGPAGWPVAGPCSAEREEILTADVDLMAARAVYGNPYNGLLADRRLDLYDQYLGYKTGRIDKSCL